jgi:hypothetical protein
MIKSNKNSVKNTPTKKVCLLQENLLGTNTNTINSSGHSTKDHDETALSVDREVPVRKLSINLMKKFQRAKTRPPKKSQEDIWTEIENKINCYKQAINFKEELNKTFFSEIQIFVEFFMNIFNKHLTDINDQFLIKESFSNIENLILRNYSLLEKNDLESRELFLLLNDLFLNLEEKLKSFELKFDFSHIIDKINELKSYVLKSEIINEEMNNINTDQIPEFSKISEIHEGKNLKTSRKKDILLSTVRIKRSTSRYGEDDELIFRRSSTTKPEYNKIMAKSRKLFLRNFLQIFLMKDNGIFSESHFSKIDKSLLNSYKKYRFYEIKFYFSVEECFKDIAYYIEILRKLFPRYIMIYKNNHKMKFLKITLCGVGKRQTLMKRKLINFMSGDVKQDCLFKISLFSNIFDCLTDSVQKLKSQKNYFFYTNFANGVLAKIIKKIN